MRQFYAILLLSVVTSAPSVAEIGTTDTAPAATLLLPYFEVNLDDPNFGTTTFTVNTFEISGSIVHVTLWTNAAVGTTSFDITLPSTGAETIDLRDIFAGQTVAGIDFAAQAPALRLAHTGQAAVKGTSCSGISLGDNVARGYVTVDVMNETGAGFPGEVGYFVNGGTGKASNDNVLFGDYSLIDNANDFAIADNLVHVEASSSDPRVTTDGNYTFYARYLNFSAADNREPLATTWGVGFNNVGGVGGTEIIYWRDPKVPTSTFACSLGPDWFPLNFTQTVEFDEAENVAEMVSVLLLPKACGRAQLGSFDFPVVNESGWVFLNLNFFTAATSLSQSFLSVVSTSEGKFMTGFQATPFAHAIEAPKL